MSDVLKAILNADTVVEKKVYMKRFGVDFTIRALAGDVIDRMQEQCTFYEGKGNKRRKVVDEQKFSSLIIVESCVEPKWNSPEILEKFQAATPADAVKKVLLAGELAKLSMEILSLSGFDEDDEEVLEDIKN